MSPTGRRGRLAGLALVSALVLATACSCATTSAPDSGGGPGSAAGDSRRCEFRPDDDNTGSRGSLDARDDEDVVLDDGAALTGAKVHDLTITGDDVLVRDVEATGAILVTGDDATLEHVTTTGVSVSSAAGTVVRYANIRGSVGDGIHVTSDRGRLVRNVVLSHNYIHSPDVPSDAHYDGTQVRGVDGLVIECSRYDPGPYLPMFNANVFLENANGGNSDVSIRHNWLTGSGFSVVVDSDRLDLIDNRVASPHWGTCYLGTSYPADALDNRGNIDARTGDAEPMCSQPAAVG